MGYSKSLYQAIHKDTLVKYLMSRDRKIKSLQKQIDDLKNVGLSNDMKKNLLVDFKNFLITK
tara:strand:- start:70 stop:255 length:186 start_codon:yes stop_codon:yes gene_type:complete